MKKILLLALTGNLYAQDVPETNNSASPIPPSTSSLLSEDWSSILGDIETIDIVSLAKINETPGFKRFADNFTITPKVFEIENEDSSIGLNWKYSKTLNKFESNITEGYHWKIESEGNIAFDNDLNPRDFLKFTTNFGYFKSSGGVASNSIPSSAIVNYRFEQAKALAQQSDSKEFRKLTNSYLDQFRSNLSPQIYFDFKGNLSYESDQDFTNQQFALGVSTSLDIKALNPSSTLAKYNILDMPFAFTRWITGTSNKFQPSGAYLPTFRIGLDSVKPTETSTTYRGGDNSNFFRFSGEVFNRSLVADLSEPIYFESSVKYYKELSPSNLVKNLGEDEKTLITFALLLPKNAYVSYSSGSLPFDKKDEKVFEVGFRWEY